MEQEQPDVQYFVDPDWYEENRHSFSLIAQSRMCLACRKRMGEEEDLSVSAFDEGKGAVVFRTVKQRYGEDPLAAIADCCSKKREYIPRNLPLAEAIFRLFLANGNRPMTPEEACQRLKDTLPDDHRDISIPGVHRLLARDQVYGFRAVASSPTIRG